MNVPIKDIEFLPEPTQKELRDFVSRLDFERDYADAQLGGNGGEYLEKERNAYREAIQRLKEQRDRTNQPVAPPEGWTPSPAEPMSFQGGQGGSIQPAAYNFVQDSDQATKAMDNVFQAVLRFRDGTTDSLFVCQGSWRKYTNNVVLGTQDQGRAYSNLNSGLVESSRITTTAIGKDLELWTGDFENQGLERIASINDEQRERREAVQQTTEAVKEIQADSFSDFLRQDRETTGEYLDNLRRQEQAADQTAEATAGLYADSAETCLALDEAKTGRLIANQERYVDECGEYFRVFEQAWGNTLSAIAQRLADWMTGAKDAWKNFGQAVGDIFALAFSQVVVNYLGEFFATTFNTLFKDAFKGVLEGLSAKSLGQTLGGWIRSALGGVFKDTAIGRLFSNIGSSIASFFGSGSSLAAAVDDMFGAAISGVTGATSAAASAFSSFAAFWSSWMGPAALYGVPLAISQFGPMIGQFLGIGSGNTSWTSRMRQRYGSQQEMLEAARGPYWGDFVSRLHLLQGADETNWEDYFRRAMTGYQHYTWLAGAGGMTREQMNAYARANLSPERYEMYTRIPEQYDVFNQIDALERSFNEWYGSNMERGDWPLAQWLQGQSGTIEALLREASDLKLREQFEPILDQFRNGTITFEEMVNLFRDAVREFEGEVNTAANGGASGTNAAISIGQARESLQDILDDLGDTSYWQEALGDMYDAIVNDENLNQLFTSLRNMFANVLSNMLSGDDESLANSIKDIQDYVSNLTTSAGILRAEATQLENGTDRLTATLNTLKNSWNALVFGGLSEDERANVLGAAASRRGTVAGLRAQMGEYEALQAWWTGEDASQAGAALAALSNEATRSLLQNDDDLRRAIEATGFTFTDFTDSTLARLDTYLQQLSGDDLTALDAAMAGSRDVMAATIERAEELAEALNLENPINELIEAFDRLIVAMLRITFQASGAEGDFWNYVSTIMGSDWANRVRAASSRGADSTDKPTTPKPGQPDRSGQNKSYQHGTTYVPRTGRYTLHQGEAVIPAYLNKLISLGQASPPAQSSVTSNYEVHVHVDGVSIDDPRVMDRVGSKVVSWIKYYERGARA